MKIVSILCLFLLLLSCSKEGEKDSIYQNELKKYGWKKNAKKFWESQKGHFDVLKIHETAHSCSLSYSNEWVENIWPVISSNECLSNHCPIFFVGEYYLSAQKDCLTKSWPHTDDIFIKYNSQNIIFLCDFIRYDRNQANNEGSLVAMDSGLCLFSSIKKVKLDLSERTYSMGVFESKKNDDSTFILKIISGSGSNRTSKRNANGVGVIFHSCEDQSCKVTLFSIHRKGFFRFVRDESNIHIDFLCENLNFYRQFDEKDLSIGSVMLNGKGNCDISVSMNNDKKNFKLPALLNARELESMSRIIDFE